MAEQFGGLAFGDQDLLELANGLQRLIQLQRLHIQLLDAHFSQLLLVVALQEAPGTGVIADHTGNSFALVGYQALIGQGATEQVDGLLELYAALGEAALVKGLALGQVVFQNLGGPFAKLHATLGFHPIANGDDDIQVEVIDLVSFAVSGSCCIFCNN